MWDIFPQDRKSMLLKKLVKGRHSMALTRHLLRAAAKWGPHAEAEAWSTAMQNSKAGQSVRARKKTEEEIDPNTPLQIIKRARMKRRVASN